MLEELLEAFFASPGAREKYRNAAKTLRDLGIEDIMRRMGEPEYIPLNNEFSQQTKAHQHSYCQGWYDAIKTIFYFEDTVETKKEQTSQPDYGAKDRIKAEFGLSDEEVEKL